MTGRNIASGAVAAVLVSGLLIVTGPSESRADALAIAPMKVALRMPKAQAIRPVKFDWLAKRGPRERVTLVSAERTQSQIGNGSWICSPAGFGKKSRCYGN